MFSIEGLPVSRKTLLFLASALIRRPFDFSTLKKKGRAVSGHTTRSAPSSAAMEVRVA